MDGIDAVVAAIEVALGDARTRTRDIGGQASTQECGAAIAAAVAG